MNCDATLDFDVNSRCDTCPFCPAWLTASTSPFDIEVARGAGIRLLPALGMLVPGYFLVTTVEHHLSFAELAPDVLKSTHRWITSVTDSLAPLFGRYLTFEHGSCAGTTSGACIDHAHLHLVPLADQMGTDLLSALNWKEQRKFSDLHSQRKRPYAYLGLDNRHFVMPEATLPSPWFRRQVAAHLHHDRWDWAVDDGIDALMSTQSSLTDGVLAKHDLRRRRDTMR